MKSWLLDAESELSKSEEDGVYTIILKFTDLFGKQRKHFCSIDLPKSNVSVRTSFTAISSINLRACLIDKVDDLSIRILFSDKTLDIPNTHVFPFKKGDMAYLIEHVDLVDDFNFIDLLIPFELPFSPEMLCLQTINADVLDESGSLIYRLSADSLPTGGCYGKRMAT